MVDDEEVFDFGALQQRLRQEYSFINQQKRELQNEYASIVSTGDSLFRNLWINEQQWKNLSRLKGGPKFSSECVYAAYLLDGISFVDGYMRVGFKEVKYGNFLRELKDNIAIIKSILIIADELKLNTSAFLRTILTSLYGSCLFPSDQKAVMLIAKSIIKYHLVYSSTPHAIFRGERNSFSYILEVILQTASSARAFLVSACKEVIINILLDGSMFWTLEEQELLSVMAVREVREKFGDPGSAGTTERIKKHMEQSWAKLTDTVKTILNKVKESLDCLPNIFLLVVSYFYTFSKTRGFSDAQAKVIVMQFLFKQIIIPCLLKPQPLIIDIEVRASNIAVFNLRKIAEILRTIISFETGEGPLNMASEAKQFYEKLDRAPLYEVIDILLDKVPEDAESLLSDFDHVPGLARTSVLITKAELDSLITLLNTVQQIDHLPKQAAEQLPNRASLKSILSHLEGVHPDVTDNMANLSVSEQSNLQNKLHDILQTFDKPIQESEEVLVISLGMSSVDCPGMQSEEKILGIPTPKPKRKPVPQAKLPIPQESLDNSQLSDSDSNESWPEEKLPEVKTETENSEPLGFEDNFVPFPSDSLFDSPSIPKDVAPTTTDQNDPFLMVISHSAVPGESLISFSDSDTPPLPRASSSITTRRPANSLLNSSGSSSSSGRNSSSASSSSDTVFLQWTYPVKQDEKSVPRTKEKGIVRKKSLKDLLSTQLSPTKGKEEKAKKKRASIPFGKRSKLSKKTSNSLLDANDVATIIAAGGEQEKTAKDICDEIISKYAKVKRGRSVSSISGKPDEVELHEQPEKNATSYDDEKIMENAKNKLRHVLSSGSKPVLPFTMNDASLRTTREDSGSVLLSYLKKDLADAVANHDCTMVARLHETLSTLVKLPSSRYPQLLKELGQDYNQRKSYISYLVRSLRGLMDTREFLQKTLQRIERDREISRRYLMTQCVGMYLDNCRDKLDKFINKFNRLSMSDERSEEMKAFLQELKDEFQNHSLWLGSNDKQRSEAVEAIERYVIGRVYWNAVYALGETDKYSDDIFHKNVELLCQSIGEDFSALDIKEEYQLEAPWFPAQYELFTLSAYKTPTDKLKCIQRCCTTIMTLLGMSSGSGAVGADAFTPVLIYVVMHANPKGLLTTVNFINSYLSEPLTGEQYYCWMQFCSAIQFIKILLEENSKQS